MRTDVYNLPMMRTFVKRSFMLAVLLDNVLTNFTKNYIIRTKYMLEGNCLKCGQCCRQIYLKATRAQVTSPLFAKLSVRWIEWLFDFKLKWVDFEDNYFVFECKNQRPDGTCGNYSWRPNVCRNYPLISYFKEPSFITGCGYSARPRKTP